MDYKRTRNLPQQFFPINTAKHNRDLYVGICLTLKRLLHFNFTIFIECNQKFSLKQRKCLRRRFCQFVYRVYFLDILKRFNFSLRNKDIRLFFKELLKWICNGFLKRDWPSLAKSKKNSIKRQVNFLLNFTFLRLGFCRFRKLKLK